MRLPRIALLTAMCALFVPSCGLAPGVRGLAPAPATVLRPTSRRPASYEPTSIVVKFRAGQGSAAKRSVATRHGLVLGREIGALDVAVFTLKAGEEPLAARTRLSGDAAIAYVEPNYRLRLVTPRKAPTQRKVLALDDPELASQWGMFKIGMGRVWPVFRGDRGAPVAVLDTGVDLDHPDLRANLVPGTTFFSEQPGPQDFEGHGTHVAGIIAAAAGNGVGVAGVAPGCPIMPIKVMGPQGREGTVEHVAAGIVWASDHGARVINLSLGDEGSSDLLRDAVRYAQSRDVLLVAASGNFDPDHHKTANTMSYPAGYPGVMAVGATDSADALADFSFWGSWLSVVAPGVDIQSTVPTDGGAAELVAGRTRAESGTSMASPFVAAVAGLIRARYPQLSAAQVKARIERTAKDLGEPGYDAHYGHGRVDAFRAVLGE